MLLNFVRYLFIRVQLFTPRAELIHRLGRAGVQSATVHEAVAIIDEAAQRIERL